MIRKHESYYRTLPDGKELSVSRSSKADVGGGSSGYPEVFDIEDWAEGEESVTFTVVRCLVQVGNRLRGLFTAKFPVEFDLDNLDVYAKVDTSTEDFLTESIEVVDQGADPEAVLGTEDGKYFYRAIYGIGYDGDGVFGVQADFRKAPQMNLS